MFTGCPIFLDWASRVAADVTPGRPATGIPASATTPVATAPAGTLASVTGPAPVTAAPSSGTASDAMLQPAAPGPPAAPAQPPTPPVARASPAPPAWTAAPVWIAEATPPPDLFEQPMKRAARPTADPGAGAGPVWDVATGLPMAVAPPAAAPPPSTSTGPYATDGGDADSEAAAEQAASMARTDLVGGAGTSSGPAGVPELAGADLDGDAPGVWDPESGNLPPWSRGRRVPVDAGAPASFGPQTRPGARPSGPREWEGGRRFEAYSAGHGSWRIRRPAFIAVAVALVAVAALVMFMLPSVFLQAGATPTPNPIASVPASPVATQRPRSTPKPGATERPTATSLTYKVKRGDTLLRIGRRFNLTVKQLTCANNIRNPNSLSVGTMLIIPIDSYECPKPTKKPK